MPSRSAVVLCYLILFYSFFSLHFSLSSHDKMRAQIKLSRLALLPKDIISVWMVCYGFQSAVSSALSFCLSFSLCVCRRQEEDWEIGLIVLKFMSFFFGRVDSKSSSSSTTLLYLDAMKPLIPLTPHTHSNTHCVRARGGTTTSAQHYLVIPFAPVTVLAAQQRQHQQPKLRQFSIIVFRTTVTFTAWSQQAKEWTFARTHFQEQWLKRLLLFFLNANESALKHVWTGKSMSLWKRSYCFA